MAKEGWKAPALLRCVIDPEQQFENRVGFLLQNFGNLFDGSEAGRGAAQTTETCWQWDPDLGRWIYVCD
jgi:hypothetical protein